MVKKERDSKFIIYQVLYIFVITVLALKGADLNLREVVSKDQTVNKSVRDSLVVLIDSLVTQGKKFQLQIDPDAVAENKELKDKLTTLNKKLQEIKKPEKKEIVENTPKVSEQTKLQSPISISQVFYQNTWNIAKNGGNVPVEIYDPAKMQNPITVIDPGQEKKFDLGGQDAIMIKYGSQQETIKTTPRPIPEIRIEKVTTKMNGSDIYVQDLQRTTVFTVTIVDNRPDQLKVTHSGPISVSGPLKDKNGNLVYNVSLNIASTQAKFNDWLDKYGDLQDASGRYKANFFFTVVDQKANHRNQVGDTFYFTDFSK
jgi:hypothetical protein